MPIQRRTTYTPRYPQALIEESYQEEATTSSDLRVAQARDYNKLLAEIRRIQEYLGLAPDWIAGQSLPLNRGSTQPAGVIGALVDPGSTPNVDAPQINFYSNQSVIQHQLAFAIYNRTTLLQGKNAGGSSVTIESTDATPPNMDILVGSNLVFPDSGKAVIESLTDPGKKEFVAFSKGSGESDLILTARIPPAQQWLTNSANIRLLDASYKDIEIGFAMQSKDGDWWRISITNSGNLQATSIDAPEPPTT